MNNLEVLNEQEVLGKHFRVYGTIDEPLFLAKDVAEWIEHTDLSRMVDLVDEDEKLKRTLYVSGQNREVWLLTEDGLYEVLMQSRKPIAKQFKKKVKEILHTIRKHGAYMTESTLEQAITNPDFLIQLATKLKEEREARKQLERTVKENEAKAVLSDAITASNTTVLIRDLAKILRKNNIKTGEKRLYQWMRENGYILKNSTRPTQYAMELGLFELCERVVSRNEFGQPIVALTTYVTGKGQKYFINKFLGGSKNE